MQTLCQYEYITIGKQVVRIVNPAKANTTAKRLILAALMPLWQI
jgi:hypothetical protein